VADITLPEFKDRCPGQSSFFERLRVLFLSGMIWFHALFILACIVGVALNLVRCFDPAAHIPSAYGSVEYTRSGQMRWVFVLTRIGWPPVTWIGQVISCCVPIAYIVWPPRAIDDDDALELDEATGVRYPKAEYWDPKRDAFPGRISDHWTTVVLVLHGRLFYRILAHSRFQRADSSMIMSLPGNFQLCWTYVHDYHEQLSRSVDRLQPTRRQK